LDSYLRFSCGERILHKTLAILEIHLQIQVPSIKMKLLFRQVLDEIGCTLLEETVDGIQEEDSSSQSD
jgi:hypothetical protein